MKENETKEHRKVSPVIWSRRELFLCNPVLKTKGSNLYVLARYIQRVRRASAQRDIPFFGPSGKIAEKCKFDADL